MKSKTISKGKMKLYFIEEDQLDKGKILTIMSTTYEDALQNHNDHLESEGLPLLESLHEWDGVDGWGPEGISRKFFEKGDFLENESFLPKYHSTPLEYYTRWLWEEPHSPEIYNPRINSFMGVSPDFQVDYSSDEHACLQVMEDVRKEKFQWALYADNGGYKVSISIISMTLSPSLYFERKVDAFYFEICRFLDWQERRQS